MEQSLWDILRDPECDRCNLCKSAQYVCLIGRGPYPCDHMLIGEAPGYREDDMGKPFAGRAGKLLTRLLDTVSMSREDVYITNIIHCRPPGNKKPNRKQMDACRYWLEKEIEYVKPKVIVLLGKSAIYGLFKNDDLNIEEMRGKRYKYKEGIRVYVTYHPAAALRRPFLKKVIKRDFMRIFVGESKKNSLQEEYLDLTKRRLEEFVDSPPEEFAVDVETPGGLIFYKNPISCLSISPKSGISYFVGNSESWKRKLRPFLENTESIKIGHNLKYDLKSLIYEDYMSEKSLVNSKLFCTMVAFNVIDENYLDKSLEHLADMFTSMKKWKNDDIDFSDPDRLRIRNLKDVDATKRLCNIFKRKLEKEKLLVPFKIDMDMMKVLVSAELHGIRLDIDRLNEVDIEITKELERLHRIIPIEKPNSTKQLTEFFNSKGIKSYKETDSGAQSWDKSVLMGLSNKLEGKKKEVVNSLIEWKKLFGIKTKFLNSLPEFIDSQNTIHPVFKQTKTLSEDGKDEEGTVTGRLSCKNPNLQQIPRDKEEVPREINPRRLFIPTYKKGFILTADYDQIEVRIAAHDADDDKLISILKSGGDVHLFVASEVLQKPQEKITRDERKQVKKVVFGIRYRISAKGLSEKIGVTEEKASKLIKFFFRAFPKQEDRIYEIEGIIVKDQEISNMFGRKRRLPGATTDTAIGRALIRQGVNFPIQGGAVDIVKIAMYKIWKELIERDLRSRIFANVHDAIDIDGFPGEEREVIEIVNRWMEFPGLEEYGVTLKVPIKATIKTGPNWLDTKQVN